MAGKIGAVQLIKQTNQNVSGSVIFFHGSGDTGRGVREWINFLLGKDLSFPHLRVIFPTAPLRPYTPSQGQLSNVWFDRLSITPDAPEHKDTLEEIGNEVKDLIKKEIELGIPVNRIVVGGFSMGGALAMHVGYKFVPEVAGVFALSSFLNKDCCLYEILSKNKNKSQCPLFMCHGERDSMVPIEWGRKTYENLRQFGVEGDFNPIKNTLHELKRSEINKLCDWIEQILPPLNTDSCDG